MKTKLRNLKGTNDFMPREQRLRQEITRNLQNIFEGYGYQPLETPTICWFDLLASKYAGGAEILKEVYKLKDQGERELGLRYDLTVPFAKVIGMNPDMPMPFKRYEIGKVFRDGPIKAGRNREFIQCDVDMVGVKSIVAEAELISMAVEVFKALALNIRISYNNRKLLSGLIQYAGIDRENVTKAILIMDKIKKIGEEEIRKELRDIGIEEGKSEILLKYMNMNTDELVSEFKTVENQLIKQGLQELDELKAYFNALGIEKFMSFDPGLARGLEIYTGTVWEVFLTDSEITSSVAAGGRYDNIIGAFLDNGNEYPAVGMTFGLDVIFAALSMKCVDLQRPLVDLYIIPLETEKESMKIAMKFREQGIKVELDMSSRKLKKTLTNAGKANIPYVMVIGEDELNSNIFKLKNMEMGCDIQGPLGDLITLLKNAVL